VLVRESLSASVIHERCPVRTQHFPVRNPDGGLSGHYAVIDHDEWAWLLRVFGDPPALAFRGGQVVVLCSTLSGERGFVPVAVALQHRAAVLEHGADPRTPVGVGLLDGNPLNLRRANRTACKREAASRDLSEDILPLAVMLEQLSQVYASAKR
jgi:hypothetical protein